MAVCLPRADGLSQLAPVERSGPGSKPLAKGRVSVLEDEYAQKTHYFP